MTFEVIPAQPTDTEELLTIYEEARLYKVSHGDSSWGTIPFTLEDIDNLLASGDLFVASVDGKPASLAVVDWADTEHWGETTGNDNQAVYIHRFATRDAFRRQHIGDQLLDWAIDKAQKADKKYMRLDCRSENERLCAYYEERGFSRQGTVRMGDVECALYQRSI